MLDRFRLYRGRSGQVGSLEVGSRKVCDSGTNGGGEIGDRFLNLSRVVVGFELVNLCDPIKRRIGSLLREIWGSEPT